MAGFSVDTNALDAVSRQISRVAVDMFTAAEPSPLDEREAGNGDVARALHKFHDHWSLQRDKLHENINKLQTLVAESAAAYDGTDQAISTAASGGDGSASAQ